VPFETKPDTISGVAASITRVTVQATASARAARPSSAATEHPSTCESAPAFPNEAVLEQAVLEQADV
jgi:hypothetical protein